MAKTLQGWERLQRRFKAIPEKVRKGAVQELERQAVDIVANMKRLAPVDDGDLRESIVATPAGKTTPPYSQPGGSTVVPELSVLITAGNTKVRYPHLVEFGTQTASAQPYFFPAYRLKRKEASRAIKRAMAKAIKETKRGN